MGLFNKKDNGEYFTKIITGITSLQKDSEFHKEKLTDIKDDFKQHKEAGYERRKIDRDWQKCVDEKLNKATECPEKPRINGIQKDVGDLKSDKKIKEGKILGIKLVYVYVVGFLGFTALILGILWRLGLL